MDQHFQTPAGDTTMSVHRLELESLTVESFPVSDSSDSSAEKAVYPDVSELYSCHIYCSYVSGC